MLAGLRAVKQGSTEGKWRDCDRGKLLRERRIPRGEGPGKVMENRRCKDQGEAF